MLKLKIKVHNSKEGVSYSCQLRKCVNQYCFTYFTKVTHIFALPISPLQTLGETVSQMSQISIPAKDMIGKALGHDFRTQF